jgi:hypothetical protein
MLGRECQRTNRKKLKSLFNPYKKRPISTRRDLASGWLGTILSRCEVGSQV